MLTHFMTALPSFFAYFGVAIAMIAVFLLVYVNVTPYAEGTLIREGNVAAAISLSGSLFGFVMPVANAIAHSDTLADLAAWAPSPASYRSSPTSLSASASRSSIPTSRPARWRRRSFSPLFR